MSVGLIRAEAARDLHTLTAAVPILLVTAGGVDLGRFSISRAMNDGVSVARCQHVEGCPGVLALADVRFGRDTVPAWLHAAFRTWLGLKAFPARRRAAWSWPQA